MRFFLGGYNPDINVAWLNPEDGSIEVSGKVTTPENGSFLRYVPELRALYAAVEAGYRTGESGKIAAYRVDENGKLTAIGPTGSCGAGPCHIAVDPDRRLLAAANYGGENFCLIRLAEDGKLGEQLACIRHSGSSVNRKRQAEPHPHACTFSPDGRFLFVCDLGTDQVMRYQIDTLLEAAASSGAPVTAAEQAAGVTAATAEPGSGPRHFEFSADGAFAYLINELSNTVVVYAYATESGDLTQLQEISTLPESFDGESTAAELQIHPNGAFVYASNRGHDTIAVFARDQKAGRLEWSGCFDTTGNGPRHFQIDPSGQWCLVSNQFSDHIVSFRIDPKTGRGQWSGKSFQVPGPSCTEFLR